MTETPKPDSRAATDHAVRKAEQLRTLATFVPELSVFTVPSQSNAETLHQVSLDPDGVTRSGQLVHFVCTCHAGEHRRAEPVPCYHAAAAALEMERLGLLERRDGLFVAVEPSE